MGPGSHQTFPPRSRETPTETDRWLWGAAVGRPPRGSLAEGDGGERSGAGCAPPLGREAHAHANVQRAMPAAPPTRERNPERRVLGPTEAFRDGAQVRPGPPYRS